MDAGRAEFLAACALACWRDAEQLRAIVGDRDDPAARMVRVAADALELRGREFEQLWRLGERGVGLPAPGPSLAEPPAATETTSESYARATLAVECVGGPLDGRELQLPARCSCGKPTHDGQLVRCRDGSVYVVDVGARRARHVPPEFLGAEAA